MHKRWCSQAELLSSYGHKSNTNTAVAYSLMVTEYESQIIHFSSLLSTIKTTSWWVLWPDCAPSSECPQASIAAQHRAAGSITISRQASCCCSNAIAGIAIEANFKMYLLRQFCSNRVDIFLQYTGDTDAKIMDQNFEIRILWFFRIFWNFQKGIARSLCGRSGPLWLRPN